MTLFLFSDLELKADVEIFPFLLFYSNRLFVQEKLGPSVIHQRNLRKKFERSVKEGTADIN